MSLLDRLTQRIAYLQDQEAVAAANHAAAQRRSAEAQAAHRHAQQILERATAAVSATAVEPDEKRAIAEEFKLLEREIQRLERLMP